MTQSTDETGVVKNIGVHVDEEGRTVLRAIVDFYDGNCPPLTFGTVWGRRPVRIVEVAVDGETAANEQHTDAEGK